MRVVDKRRHPFFIVYNRVLDEFASQLSPIAFMVLCVITRYANFETGECWRRHDLICKTLGVHRNTVKRAVKQLVRLGLIDVVSRPGGTNLYIVRVDDFHPAEIDHTDPDCSDVDICPDGSPVVHLDETTGGPLVSPPRTTGEPPPPCSNRNEQDLPPTTAAEAAAAGDELGTRNAEGAALLYDCGVVAQIADDLSNRLDVSLIGLIVSYWQAGAGGNKEVGPGLLVRICQNPAGYGFVKRDGSWHAPKTATKGRKPNVQPAEKPTLTIAERAAKVKAEREAAALEAQKAREDNRNAPPLRDRKKGKE